MILILRKIQNEQWRLISLSDDDQVLQARDLSDLSELATLNKQHRIIVLLPGEKVLVTRILIPKASRAELEKAVPFALEEQLAEDIQELQFCLGDFDEDGRLLVGVINREFLTDILQTLTTYNITPDKVLPDFLALSQSDAAWTMVIENQKAVVRCENGCGFSVEIDLLENILALHEQQNTAPKKINCYGNVALKNLPSNITINKKNDDFKHALDGQALLKSTLNLLPKKMRIKKKVPKLKQSWQIVFLMTLVLIVALFGSRTLTYFMLKHRVVALNEQIKTTYQQIFPNAKAIIAPRVRIKKSLSNLQRALQGNTFLYLLEKTGKVFQNNPQIRLQKLSFHDEQLTISVKTIELADLNRFSEALNTRNLSINQKQLNIGKHNVSADYQIRR